MSSSKQFDDKGGATLSRRALVGAAGVTAATVVAGRAFAQQPPATPPRDPAAPPSTVTTPPRDFGPNAPPNVYFTDPDVITVDPSFDALRQPNAPIQRLWTGALWSEGPAWNAQGRYLVWSDIPNNRQLRWIEDNGRVSVFRTPSNNSNGNTFDFQGRQLSCEHLTRRVVRYELDGSATVLAEAFQGKKLNSPNDVVAHPDGSYWFTDPPYGGQLYEGTPDVAGGPSNLDGKINPRLGQPPGIGTVAKRELPTNCYRIDPSGRIDLVVTEEQVPDPNGLCFSPDYKTLYVASTGKGPGDTGPGGKGEVYSFTVGTDNKVSNRKLFSDCMVDGIKCGPDGLRCDVVWQCLGLQQRRPQRRLQRRHGVEPRGQAIGPHPPARGLRQRLLRRPQAQPPVHGREPVALCALCRRAGRGAGLSFHLSSSPPLGRRARRGGIDVRAPSPTSAPSGMEPSEEANSPLVVLDHLRRAHLGLVGVAAELAQGAALAQKIPALVELDIDRRQARALGVGHVALGVELLLLGHQPLDVIENALVRGVQGHGHLRVG